MLFVFELLPGFTADTPGVFMFGMAGAVVQLSAFRRVLTVILALAATLVLLVTQTSLSNAVAANWVRHDAFPDSGVAAIVVLSAGVNPNNTINGEALDHLIDGIELVRMRNVNLLVTTTVEERFATGLINSTVDQGRIISLFDGRVRWLRAAVGSTTRDEALEAARLLLPQGVRKIALVASPLHTKRACSSFEAVGFQVTCVPSRLRSPGGGNPAPWPADRLRVFGGWIYEVAATAKYESEGWLRSDPTRRGPP
jgi:uncharacterized SAM-binding protein YcdF (DUF218 family)